MNARRGHLALHREAGSCHLGNELSDSAKGTDFVDKSKNALLCYVLSATKLICSLTVGRGRACIMKSATTAF